jgi:hypothetical protein
MKTLKTLFMLYIVLGLAVPANSQGKQVERPIKGSFYAVVTGSEGPIETLSITGIASHLGIVKDCEMTLDKAHKFAMSGSIRAANGDYFYFSGIPILIPYDPLVLTSGTFTVQMTIEDGTGRFIGCSGWLEATGTYDMVNDYAMWTAEGTIIY